MASEYCPSCGTKNLYDFNKPKFCCGCGESFGGIQAKKTNTKIKTKRRQYEEEEEDQDGEEDGDEYNDNFNFGELTELKCTFDEPEEKPKLGQVIASAPNTNNPQNKLMNIGREGAKIPKKKVKEEMLKFLSCQKEDSHIAQINSKGAPSE